MCTRTRGAALGCSVWGSYATNQIVQEVDLTTPNDTMIRFQFQNKPTGKGVFWVFNWNEPRTDIFYPKGNDAAKNWQALQSTIVDEFDCDCIFSDSYFTWDAPVEFWNDTYHPNGYNYAWGSSGDIFTGSDIYPSSRRYSFLFIVDGKMHSVSSFFTFTPGTKIINCTEWMYGTSSYNVDL